jgi:mono/diheme cytochrome c family protein
MNEFDQRFGSAERRSQRARSMALLVMVVSSVLASFPSAASTEEEAFAHYQNSVDALIQSKCIVCHVSGGQYGGIDLVYVRGSSLSQQETNFGKLKNYIEKGRGQELLSRP